ncbi:putative alpha-1,3-mannosyl-glycoprotein 2-beta-N-acetylglucosaminyltransferase [Apostichopus japonicus]|uniref:Alpha-1,3-mannosyl-glycoprotein 2-beta-N-acetylglucosaminyltransferase n=1 Tax=Stichopus japonicus TaxID=307972 RepID=A0A2G8LLR6_STIJA|nr:putative alpha-1,3-mannosyl-glycoprotein 2-beta-N-acetylglucosaminyltransferase [Apostichopus japonicus]
METNQQLLVEIDKQKQLILRNTNRQRDRRKLHDNQEGEVKGLGDKLPPEKSPVLPVEDLPQNRNPKAVIPVLVIACNRPSAIKRSLETLLKNRPSKDQFPIVVSQDCGHAETATVIEQFGDQISFIKQPNLGKIQDIPSNLKKFEGYYKISRHYKWALGQVFNVLNYDSVLVVEDDLDVAVDFFQYFAATHHLLLEDDSLWCVSAWNDNGKSDKVKDPEMLYRSDFFPGLGWMMTKKVWQELESKWPTGFWDDWMRHPDQRKDRACIRPEISRTDTFGKEGVSKILVGITGDYAVVGVLFCLYSLCVRSVCGFVRLSSVFGCGVFSFASDLLLGFLPSFGARSLVCVVLLTVFGGWTGVVYVELVFVATLRYELWAFVQEGPFVCVDNDEFFSETEVAPLRLVAVGFGSAGDRPIDSEWLVVLFQLPDVLREFRCVLVFFVVERHLVVTVSELEGGFFRPMYVLQLSMVFTSALYMMLDAWQFPFSGHVSFFRQLQASFSFDVWVAAIRLLCPLMMLAMLGMQL